MTEEVGETRIPGKSNAETVIPCSSTNVSGALKEKSKFGKVFEVEKSMVGRARRFEL
jgi:hypothetical protein